MKSIVLQIYHQEKDGRGKWFDAAEIKFSQDDLKAPVELSYLNDYLISVPSFDAKDNWSCTVNAPVSAIPTEYLHWPALLDDLLPVGKSRDWWLQALDATKWSIFEQQYSLLTHACMSPVGNVRVKEAVANSTAKENRTFEMNDVTSLQHDFLTYAYEQGQAVGGATGAGGMAPKLLLMLNEQERVFIDADFAGKPLNATAYLIKFARNNRTELDNHILIAEGVYYRALDQILKGTDIQTIHIDLMRTEAAQNQSSLWLPRFDVVMKQGIAHRLGLESVYSIINAGAGSHQDHFEVMARIWHKIADATRMSQFDFIKQYLTRDFLNIVFGNSDNHGRNISFLKHDGDITFAPIYDFAPMKADPEMVIRTFRWGNDCERAGRVQFDKIVAQISRDDAENRGMKLDHSWQPELMMQFLSQLAERLITLPELLSDLGCPDEILHFQAIGFAHIEDNLREMGVLNG